jgi:hypothetical protein
MVERILDCGQMMAGETTAAYDKNWVHVDPIGLLWNVSLFLLGFIIEDLNRIVRSITRADSI